MVVTSFEYPMLLHANLVALCFIEAELLQMKALHYRNRNFRRFWPYDLDLDPMTFIYKTDPYSMEIFRICKTSYFKVFESYRLTERQTNRHDRNYIPRRFADGQQNGHISNKQ